VADQKGVVPGERGKVRVKAGSYSGRWNTAGGWKKAVMPYGTKSLAWKLLQAYAITDGNLPVILSPYTPFSSQYPTSVSYIIINVLLH